MVDCGTGVVLTGWCLLDEVLVRALSTQHSCIGNARPVSLHQMCLCCRITIIASAADMWLPLPTYMTHPTMMPSIGVFACRQVRAQVLAEP